MLCSAIDSLKKIGLETGLWTGTQFLKIDLNDNALVGFERENVFFFYFKTNIQIDFFNAIFKFCC